MLEYGRFPSSVSGPQPRKPGKISFGEDVKKKVWGGLRSWRLAGRVGRQEAEKKQLGRRKSF